MRTGHRDADSRQLLTIGGSDLMGAIMSLHIVYAIYMLFVIPDTLYDVFKDVIVLNCWGGGGL